MEGGRVLQAAHARRDPEAQIQNGSVDSTNYVGPTGSCESSWPAAPVFLETVWERLELHVSNEHDSLSIVLDIRGGALIFHRPQRPLSVGHGGFLELFMHLRVL